MERKKTKYGLCLFLHSLPPCLQFHDMTALLPGPSHMNKIVKNTKGLTLHGFKPPCFKNEVLYLYIPKESVMYVHAVKYQVLLILRTTVYVVSVGIN